MSTVKTNYLKIIIVFSLLAIFIWKQMNTVYAQTEEVATLIRTIDTSQWSPPSPDPAGITYSTLKNTFLIVDSEVEEMPIYFQGANLYEANIDGALANTFSTTSFSIEPTDITINQENGHLFISDDDKKRIFEINLGQDGLYGTTDDTIRWFSTTSYGNTDPEGVAYGQGKLFIVDGLGSEIYTISPGTNGIFEGSGDDQIAHFDTSVMRQADPEGVAYNPDNNSLFIITNGNSLKYITETTLAGAAIRYINISSLNARATAGIVYAPSSLNASKYSIYVVARGVDNNTDPTENDGKIYEISLTPAPACLSKSIGDADCNMIINLIDFEIWRKEYFALCNEGDLAVCAPDEDSDGVLMDADFDGIAEITYGGAKGVSISDFEVWRKGRFGG